MIGIDFELLPEGDFSGLDDELEDVVDPLGLGDLETDSEIMPIGRTVLMDFDTGQAGGRPGWVRGEESVVQIAQVALRTKRGSYSIFDEDFGMTNPESLIGFLDDPELRADYERDTDETLRACHDRITAVSDFLYLADPDSEEIHADLTIEIDGDVDVRLESVPVG